MATRTYLYSNINEWLFPVNPVTAANAKNVLETNQKINNLLVDQTHLLKVKRSCFEQCVTDFSSTNFQANEKACLNNCSNQSYNLLYDFSFSTNNI
jgi:hypothetical protein